jgi:hypothetical protein
MYWFIHREFMQAREAERRRREERDRRVHAAISRRPARFARIRRRTCRPVRPEIVKEY